jgi:hypothetical protein
LPDELKRVHYTLVQESDTNGAAAVEYDPTTDVAVPASTYEQRLGMTPVPVDRSAAPRQIPRKLECQSVERASVGKVPIRQLAGEPAFTFNAGLKIDADGAPNAYNPDSAKGLDRLANAGHPGNWWGLVTDAAGNPIIQGPNDPAPGFYVSKTALGDGTSLHPYVDSTQIPYISLPPEAKKAAGMRLGDSVVVVNTTNGKVVEAILADVGPVGKIGEGSIKLAQDLGIGSTPRRGGVDSRSVTYFLFPGSMHKRPPAMDKVLRNLDSDKNFCGH